MTLEEALTVRVGDLVWYKNTRSNIVEIREVLAKMPNYNEFPADFKWCTIASVRNYYEDYELYQISRHFSNDNSYQIY